MFLVIDSNVLISSLIAGRLTEIILSPKLELIAPECVWVEFDNNKSEIIKKSGLTSSEFVELLIEMQAKIKVVPMDEYVSFFGKAEKILGKHVKDAPFIALALKYDCPFWSYEKRFSKIDGVEVLTTKEVRLKLNKESAGKA